MVRSLKTGLAKAARVVTAACGIVVLAVAMAAAVVVRWATKPTHDIPEAEFTSESARTER